MGKARLYSFDDHPEHRERLDEFRDKWIANAMSTAPMTSDDKLLTAEAIKGMYRKANLKPPPDHRIVFVPSPLVARLAGGFAAWIWYCRKRGMPLRTGRPATVAATRDATRDATHAATVAATRAATVAATRAATVAATDAATRDATDAATRDATDAATAAATRAATRAATAAATDAATRAATDAATLAATRAATDAATDAATRAATAAATHDDLSRWYSFRADLVELAREFGDPVPLLDCTYKAYSLWQGGNQWSGWCSYLSFFRHVAQIPGLDTTWDDYETAAIHSGPRLVHDEFCIISDRPEVLLVDDQNRPHCDDGPFCRWRDGFALYSIHGVRVPAWVVLHPDRITPSTIAAETNIEIRRVMIEKFGVGRYLHEIHAQVIDMDALQIEGSACRILLRDPTTGEQWLEGTDGSTERIYFMNVPREAKTCREAHSAICGFDESRMIAEA